MADQRAVQERFHQVLQLPVMIDSTLSLDSLRRLCCASKLAATTVKGYLTEQSAMPHEARLTPLHKKLVASVRDEAKVVGSPKIPRSRRDLAAQHIAWLLGLAGTGQQVFDAANPGFQQLVLQLLQIPHIPKETAATLVANGFRCTYKQLLSAAQQPVQGVEVWLQAYDLLKMSMPPTTPKFVKELAHQLNSCVSDLEMQMHLAATRVRQETLVDCISFAIAMNRTRKARVVLPAFIDTHNSRKLSTEVVFELLTRAIKVQAPDRVVALVEFLAAAQQLTATSLSPLLEAALHSKRYPCVQALCDLPGNRDLTAADVNHLLQLATRVSGHHSFRALCKLQGAEQLQAGDLYEHLAVAVGRGYHKQVAALCQLPAAQNIPAQHAVGLLRAAARKGTAAIIKAICGLAAVKQLEPETLFQLETEPLFHLMSMAVQKSDGNKVAVLCQLPAARHLSARQATRLLKASVKFDSACALQAICGLPAAQQITRKTVYKVASMAAQGNRYAFQAPDGSKAAALCQLPAAQQMSARQVLDLLVSAIQCDGDSALAAICKLPALQQIETETAFNLVLIAAQIPDSSKVAALCQLPAAQQMSPPQVLSLLDALTQGDDPCVLEAICDLPAAQQPAVKSRHMCCPAIA